jgi:hypothetical protein
VGDGFALTSVLYTVASVEESTLDGDEGIVVVAKLLLLVSLIYLKLEMINDVSQLSRTTHDFKNPVP